MEVIVIRNEVKIRSIRLSELSAIELEDYLCTFYMDNKEQFSYSNSLNKVQEKLPSNFLRINKNCIIDTKKIKEIDVRKRMVTLYNGMSFGFSSRKAKTLKDILTGKNTFIQENSTLK